MFKVFLAKINGTDPKIKAEELLAFAFEDALVSKTQRCIALDANGKPKLISGAIQFNVSHCNLFVACAVTKNYEVGVDVEVISRRVLNVSKKIMNKAELEELSHKTENDKLKALTKRWTQLESYFKMTGEGIKRFFSTTLPTLESISQNTYILNDNGQTFFVHSYFLDGAILSVASKLKDTPMLYFKK